MVYIWDVHSAQLQYKLPGHHGSVNEVVFHPKVRRARRRFRLQWAPPPTCSCLPPRLQWRRRRAAACRCSEPEPQDVHSLECLLMCLPQEPIIGSCSSDKNIYLGELAE